MSIVALVLVPLLLIGAWRWWRRPSLAWEPDRTPVIALVRVPLPLGPLDRHERLEVPLEDALGAWGLGEVDDADSLQADDGRIVAVTVTLRLTDASRAIPVVLDVLRLTGCPAESSVTWTTAQGLRSESVGASA